MTPGIDNRTIDGTSFETLMALKESVLEQRFRWDDTRRVYIPKKDGGQRALGIPTFQNRIVQEVIRVILQAIYEHQFSNKSHGYRPGRSQHSALRYIRKEFGGTV